MATRFALRTLNELAKKSLAQALHHWHLQSYKCKAAAAFAKLKRQVKLIRMKHCISSIHKTVAIQTVPSLPTKPAVVAPRRSESPKIREATGSSLFAKLREDLKKKAGARCEAGGKGVAK